MKFKFLFATLLIFVAKPSYPCKCGGPDTVEGSFASSDVILSGLVLCKELVPFTQTVIPDSVSAIIDRIKDDEQKLDFLKKSYVYKIELEVSEKYKGTNICDTLTIYTSMNSASCGYKFEERKSFIIYASKKSYLEFMFMGTSESNKGFGKEGTYWTNQCTRTTEYNDAEAEKLRLLSEN